MKKAKRKTAAPRRAVRESAAQGEEMLPHYDFSAGVRGKYAARYREGTNVLLLEPDVAERFPDAAAVNRFEWARWRSYYRACGHCLTALGGSPATKRPASPSICSVMQ